MKRVPRWLFLLTIAAVIAASIVGYRWLRPDPDAIMNLDQVAAAPEGGPSWAPRPVEVSGLRELAKASAAGFSVATEHGPVTFLSGVNLGSTSPGHQPGELSITAGEYHSWLAAMGRLGVRFLRIYTIHPPTFYDELRDYNLAHADAPLYLLQGVYLPDESYVDAGDLYGPGSTQVFTQEIRDAVQAVHGDLERQVPGGRASGTWGSDVSDWLVGWVIGVEWDPEAILASDQKNAAQPAYAGRFFTSVPGATPTERWLAARMDEVATAEAAHTVTVPIAFVNWPTTDPLVHPEEPLPTEDLVGVDANRIAATPAWPAGQFASYHAYPYYPDFQRYEPALATHQYRGRADPYAGYLTALKQHHAQAGLPVVITEFGVPSAVGSAHYGPLGRDQGNHNEQEAMRVDAELLHLIKDAGLSGALLFGWDDEWFKFTWNTINHQLPAEQRQRWHDALTNEQWFGLVATDPTGEMNPDTQSFDGQGPVSSASAHVDEGYLHLDVQLEQPATGDVVIALDAVPSLSGRPAPGTTDPAADVALVLNPSTHDSRLWIRPELDPVPLDYPVPAGSRPPPVNGWQPFELLVNRSQLIPSTQQKLAPEFLDLSHPRFGNWDPDAPDYDSNAVWNSDGSSVHVRLPWAMADLSDPSSHHALLPAAPDHTVVIPGLGLSVTANGSSVGLGIITWNDWSRIGYRVRLKAGAGAMRDAFVAVSASQ